MPCPRFSQRHPKTVYVVLGATHPHVKEQHGETYRLIAREPRAAAGRRLEHDLPRPFREPGGARRSSWRPPTSTSRLTSSRSRSPPGRWRTRSVPARPSISTPYWYASELLADGRGLLVPWRDAPAIARAVIDLFGDDAKRRAMRERAAAFGRNMVWPAVARRYVETFERARAEHAIGSARCSRPRPRRAAGGAPGRRPRHFAADDRRPGILQHARVQRAPVRGRLLPGRQRTCLAVHGAPRGCGNRGLEDRSRCWRRATWRSSATRSTRDAAGSET